MLPIIEVEDVDDAIHTIADRYASLPSGYHPVLSAKQPPQAISTCHLRLHKQRGGQGERWATHSKWMHAETDHLCSLVFFHTNSGTVVLNDTQIQLSGAIHTHSPST